MIWIVNIFIFEEWLVVVLSARLFVLFFFCEIEIKNREIPQNDQ